MLVVCKKHVKEGIKCFDVPHVKKIRNSKLSCLLCKEEAKIEVFLRISDKPTFFKLN
jgi:hypothetical protein